ncbi:hypothetical protein Tco_0371274 [Tanacetum coccineum]
MSFAIPIGLEIDRSASSSVMQVGVRSGSESFSQTENGIRLMLAPRSANAKNSSSLEIQKEFRNLPGYPSFLGFIEVEPLQEQQQEQLWLKTGLRRLNWTQQEVGSYSVLPGLAGHRCYRRVPEPEVEAVLDCNNLLKACQSNLPIWDCRSWDGAEAWFFLSKSNARNILSQATSDETAWVESSYLLATTALARV